ncbi:MULTISPECIES: ammonium transporter [Methylotenera]|uniref:ammonium transporter n=1 Tax=Methylotenera TaxID=359407 RepID=UPI00036FBEFE|nr:MULTISPECIES: ammonium transporter [Methylotenera]
MRTLRANSYAVMLFVMLCAISSVAFSAADDISNGSALQSPVTEQPASTDAATAATDQLTTEPIENIPAEIPVVLPASVPPPPIIEPAPTKPFLTGFDAISSGDTAWMLSATALVLLMTIPGLVLFYTGMVRRKNVLSTALQSFAICCLVTVIWIAIGYSIAFTPGDTPYLGSFDRVMLSGLSYIKASSQLTVSHLAPSIPESVFVVFQMTFAIITPALIVGAFAERMRFSAMLLFITLWSILVYAPVAHWVWEPTGFFASKGVLDFAGGTVVHINAGAAGLVCAYMLGPRTGYGKVPFMPYNLVYTLTGAALLWVGWFGFNAGSAVSADGRAGMAMLVTQAAAAMAALTWVGIEYYMKSRITMLGFASGAVAGLVAITPASGFVNVGGALTIGLAAGVLCYLGATSLKRFLGADDALDVFGIHGIGGLVGAILTGVLADKTISGLDANVWMQTLAAFGTLIYSGIVTLIILVIVNIFISLRVDAEQEHDGLDLTQHAERVM